MSLAERLPTIPVWAKRALWLGVLLAMVAFLLVPALTDWWDQRERISQSEAELANIEDDNDELRKRLDLIGDPTTVERIARRDLGLVREGEESYTILPPATAGVVMPDTWPFDRVAPAMASAGR
ncbi:MAG: FtsB family cell division protein [Microthrixaceae bacterium]